uniref:Keratin n=1 Tax=Strigops habroptila TaxID=2489341 RepID=A0A672TFY1_STRHB
MSSYRQLCNYQCSTPSEVACPQPITNAWNEPCVTSCGDSRAVVYPPPVVITFPGPILSSCPQESIVGSSAPAAIGTSLGYGGSYGYRGSSVYRGSEESKFSYPYFSQRFSGYRSRRCEPCQTQQEYTCTKSSQDTECKIQTQE